MRRLACAMRAPLALLLAIAAIGLVVVRAEPAAPATLEATIEDVARRWPGIGHIKPTQLEVLLRAGEVVLFDARTPAEYAVSHLPGAISIAPDLPTGDFLDRYAAMASGKTAVFYCSVGVRSSKLAERVAPGLKARGAAAVDDLAGGIFAWHGEGRALVDANGPTDFVHPYDSTWGRLLARPQQARSSPGG